MDIPLHLPPPAPGSQGRRGLTLVELMVCTVVLVIGVGSTLASLGSFVGLEETQRETATATLAARQQIEAMQAVPFRQVFATFNGNPADDPDGPGTALGSGFAVDGLAPRPGDADGLAGEVRFAVASAAPGVLREDIVEPSFGMPTDLTGDGAIDALDHASDYNMLPVRVRVQWSGKLGNSSVEIQAMLGAR